MLSTNPTTDAIVLASPDQLHGVVPLPHFGVIQVSGEDAAIFTHGQLTQDFSLLGQDQARLAAYCSAKGRMLASFIGLKRSSTEILLICHRDVIAATVKRLSMFVLRAKVKLADVSDVYRIYGAVGKAIEAPNASVWSKAELGEKTVVQLPPSMGLHRQLWISTSAIGHSGSIELTAWRWLDVRSGVALVRSVLTDVLVPQMLNYESIGGISFKKGCYPGQEVVARSQFRGTIKRRGMLVHSSAPLDAGMDVFSATDPEQAIGVVVDAAPCPTGGVDAIISVQVSAAQGGGLRLGNSERTQLVLIPLPYSLLEDI